jgi:hypothetical protein
LIVLLSVLTFSKPAAHAPLLIPLPNNVCSTARLAARPHALRPCARQPRGCHFNWLWPFVMLRTTPQLSSALPRPAFGSCQIHPADTYLMGRRSRCSQKCTHTPSGVCSTDRNIHTASARIMIDGQLSQQYVQAPPRLDSLLRPAKSSTLGPLWS